MDRRPDRFASGAVFGDGDWIAMPGERDVVSVACPSCGQVSSTAPCAACQERAQREVQTRARIAHFEAWLRDCGVPLRYRTVPIDWPMPETLRAWEGEPWSLTILGPVGVGKTSLAVAVLGRVAALLGEGTFVTAPQLIRGVLADIQGRGGRVLDRVLDVPVLVLDDLGTEGGGEFAQSQISAVLCARYDHLRATVVTTNLDLDALEPRIGSRLASGLVLRLEGRDYRLPVNVREQKAEPECEATELGQP